MKKTLVVLVELLLVVEILVILRKKYLHSFILNVILFICSIISFSFSILKFCV